MLSIITPSYKDPYLQKTIDDIHKNAKGDIEIIVILDGYDDEITGATIIRNPSRRGLRDCVNSGIAISHGDYILKCDAHCMFDEGFDVKLLADIKDNWVVIPRRYKLDTDKWVICEDDKDPIDYEKLVTTEPDRICGLHWSSRAKERKDILIDETMVFQGSCWVMSRKHWDWLGGLQEEGYGTFTQEPVEIALKTWLGGGKVMVNKKTWYAHQHRRFGRTHTMSNKEIKDGNAYSRDFWLNNRWDKRIHDIEWFLDRFKGNKPVVSILLPSRRRPNELLRAINSFGSLEGIEILVWLDTDDLDLKEYQRLFGSNPNIKLFIKERVGYNKFNVMVDFLANQASADWTFLFGDDAYMENKDWFNLFKDYVKNLDPENEPIVINICGQGDRVYNLFPIMSRKYFEIVGHSSLTALVDDWVRRIAKGAGINHELAGMVPKHRKYTGDDILKDHTYWEVDKDMKEFGASWNLRINKEAKKLLDEDIQKVLDYKNRST